MPYLQTIVGILILATSSVFVAQSTQTKPPDGGGSRAPNSPLPLTPSFDPCQNDGSNQVAILSDTMGADLSPYLTRIRPIVRRNWHILVPDFTGEALSKPGKVAIEFLVLKDGRIDVDSVTIQTSSGDVRLDRAARGGIVRSDPLPALPKEFLGQKLRLRFFFYYNLSPDIGISPCVDVRVPAGSTLQFSASGKGITNTSVKWRVFGIGCSESACGTISDTGLYTAPLNIPIPPVVSVRAAPRSGNGLEAQSKVIVVQAIPSR
jgi:TonB family protein